MSSQRGKMSSSSIHVSTWCRKYSRHYGAEQSGTWIDGQGGARGFLTFIIVKLVSKGRSFFLSGEEREGELFLAFTHLVPQERARVSYEPVSENPIYLTFFF